MNRNDDNIVERWVDNFDWMLVIGLLLVIADETRREFALMSIL